ncbi:MAG: hypothetical protein QOJ19_620 [Acidimicrobiia bacterium]|nr:hypothetical protein [Acidimicrobiia bacterium]
MGCGLSKAHIRPEVLVSHGNARLTVHGRKLIVERHAAGWRRARAASHSPPPTPPVLRGRASRLDSTTRTGP